MIDNAAKYSWAPLKYKNMLNSIGMKLLLYKTLHFPAG